MFDSPIDRHRRTKKTLRPLWLLIAALLVAFAYFLYATVGPNPPIIVSKATTHLTTPLGKDGFPDYAAVLLADTMKGVTPETNAAVPLLEALEVEEFEKLSQSDRDDLKLVFDAIGAEWPPDASREVPTLYSNDLRIEAVRLYRERVPRPLGISSTPQAPELAEQQPVKVGEEVFEIPGDASDGIFWSLNDEEAAKDNRAYYYEDRVHDRPWTRNDLPFLADWFDENAEPIDRVVAGLERTQWGLPKAAWIKRENDPTSWVEITSFTTARQVARVLFARTLYRTGQKDWQSAKRDALAIMRLTAHFSKGPFLIDQLVATALDGMAASAIRQIALASDVPAYELRTLLHEFDAIGSASRMSDAMDQGERYYGLSEVIACANAINLDGRLVGHINLTTFQAEPLPALVHQALCRYSVDWNVALRRFNATFDQVVVATKLANGRDRRVALQPIDAQIGAALEKVQSTASGFGRIWTPTARGELAADVLQSVSAFGFEHYSAIEDRNRIDRALTRAAIALAIYRAENGEYPESLDDLAPGVLATTPVDPVYGGPFAYHRTGDGFLIYSLGFNGVDDGGSNDGESLGYAIKVFKGIRTDEIDDPTEAANLTAKIPNGADDLSFRAPLPIKPWPWEKPPGDSSPPAAVESSSSD